MISGITNELLSEFKRRQAKPEARPRHRRNAKRYSLRAFAEDLELSHGFVSRVLRGERHLSQDQADAIGNKLGLAENERLRFVDLARVSAIKNKRLQREVLSANPALRPSTGKDEREYALLDPNDFYVLKRWYYPALMEMIKVEPQCYTAKVLAKRLNLSLIECEVALERLAGGGFVAQTIKDGINHYSPSHSPLRTGNLSSARIREFHQQMLSKAKETLDREHTDLCHITGITFAADASRYEQARCLIDDFRKELADLMKGLDPAAANSVYQFNVQLFRIDRVPPELKK